MSCAISKGVKNNLPSDPPILIRTNEKIDYKSSTSAVPCSYLELDFLLRC